MHISISVRGILVIAIYKNYFYSFPYLFSLGVVGWGVESVITGILDYCCCCNVVDKTILRTEQFVC